MDSYGIKSQFNQILVAAKERRGDLSVDSMIVSSHLAQMRTFMLRRGIEFLLIKIHLVNAKNSFIVFVKTICLK